MNYEENHLTPFLIRSILTLSYRRDDPSIGRKRHYMLCIRCFLGQYALTDGKDALGQVTSDALGNVIAWYPTWQQADAARDLILKTLGLE